jgi:hypothetical protein
MKSIFSLFLVLTIVIQSNAQNIPKRIRQKITNRYSSNLSSTGLKLDINGYYLVHMLYKIQNGNGYDTTSQKIAFFDDGGVRVSYGTKPIMLRDSFYVSEPTCGVYSVNDDSIVVQLIYHMQGKRGRAEWGAWEQCFKVIDNRTLLLLYVKDLYCDTRDGCLSTINTIPANFIVSESIPSNDCWLKKEDWMWYK